MQKLPRHLNMVAILRHGEVLDSALYYIDMELCDGNLEDYIEERRFSGPSPLDIKEFWNIMTQITCGLVHIHKAHLVHRDLKPRNSICSLITF